jgi:hypothetical protein
MSDESKLQVALKDASSSPSVSRTGSRLVARGLRDVAVVLKTSREREVQIVEETSRVICDVCNEFEIPLDEGHEGWIEFASKGGGYMGDELFFLMEGVKEIARRLRQLGLFEELVRMKRDRCDALHAMDHSGLLELALQKPGSAKIGPLFS